MHDEELRNAIDLCYYRIERARQDLKTAQNLFDDEDYRAANNRAYYSIFHSLRSVLALDHYDSKKHSGIISEFRRRYLKTHILPIEMSAMIDSSFEIRNASDYNDMYLASRGETKTQIENAEYILAEIEKYIGRSIDTYKRLFDEDGGNKNSQILNLLLVSLFSSDTLLTTDDCNRSERELLKIKWAIEETDLSGEMKAHWNDYVEKGIEICRRDRAEMEKQV